MDWILDCVATQLNCDTLTGETKITDSYITNNAVSLAESLDILRSILLSLREEAETLGLKVFCVKTKMQS